MAMLRFAVLAIVCLVGAQHADGAGTSTVSPSFTPTVSTPDFTMATHTVAPSASTSNSPPASSTIFPSSSRFLSPTPTPTQTPDIPSSNHVFFLNGTDNNKTVTCVLLKVEMKLSITYDVPNATDVNKTTTNSVELDITKEMFPAVDDSSNCNYGSDAILTIAFFNGSHPINSTTNRTEFIHYISFNFSKEEKDDYELKSVSINLDSDDTFVFPGLTTNTSIEEETKDTIFSVSLDKSYECSRSQSFSMTNMTWNVTKVTLTMNDFQAQALSFKNDQQKFDKSKSCVRDQESSKIVPIAVGAALAGLVVVVLIAYLIGRFRSRKQNSYEALS